MITGLEGSITGLKQSTRAVKKGVVKMAFVARDADSHVRLPFVRVCEENGVPVTYVETCRELGAACGLDVGAAVAVVKNTAER